MEVDGLAGCILCFATGDENDQHNRTFGPFEASYSSDTPERPRKIQKTENKISSEFEDEKDYRGDPRYATIFTLSDLGATMDIEDSEGLTPLFHAIRSNDIGMIKALLLAGASLNYTSSADNLFLGGTALHQAAAKGSTNTVRTLLALGAQTNLEDHFGKTPVHWAAWEGRLDNLKVLAEHLGDLTAEDSWDRTPLHMAADGGHVEVVEWLIQNKADPCAICSEDNTPLHYASIGGHIDVVKFFSSSGCKRHFQRSYFCPATSKMVLMKQPEVTVDARDILGRTPLMCAVRHGRLKTVQTLLAAGAAARNKDDFGVSVLDWTADLETSEIADIITEALARSCP